MPFSQSLDAQRPLLRDRSSLASDASGSAAVSLRALPLSPATARAAPAAPAAPAPVSLTFSRLTYARKSGKGERAILRGVSGHVRSGEMLAVLGPSGAGKSTLLDILAQRAKSGAVGGDVRLNGRVVEHRVFQRVSAYVQQEDLLQSFLTVEESIYYAGLLRTPPSTTKKSLLEQTQRVMEVLGIDHVKNTKIGSEVVRGISGGEKKRCAIAMELVASPSLLFLDEPTTGLDTFTALHLLKILKNLARTGVAIVFSIHQPRSSIFRLFDKLLLLNGNGEEVFFGPAREAMPFFARLGIAPKYSENPADFLLDSVSVVPKDELNMLQEGKEEDEEDGEVKNNGGGADEEGEYEASDGEAGECARVKPRAGWTKEAQIARMQSTLVAEAFHNELLSEVEENVVAINNEYQLGSGLPAKVKSPYSRNIFTQIRVVATREFLNKIRDPIGTVVTIIVSMFFALLIGSVYFRLGHSQGSIQNRMGVLFFIVMNTAFSSLTDLTLFMANRAIFVRDHQNGMYCVAAYYIGQVIQSLPVNLVVNLIFDLIVYFMIGLQPQWEKVLMFYFVCTLIMLNSYSLCLLISNISKNMQVANVLGPLVFVLLLLPSGGVLMSLNSLPTMWVWLKYVSFVRYGLGVLVVNEFDGLYFDCSESLPICITNGTAYAESLGYHMEDIWKHTGILAGSVGVYFVLGFLALFFLRTSEGK